MTNLAMIQIKIINNLKYIHIFLANKEERIPLLANIERKHLLIYKEVV